MSRLVNPIPQYRPFSKMYFFKSGTNTQLATYKDELESIANSHPVLCDANGNLPNVFFNGTAKMVGLDENSVQYFERDPVNSQTQLGDFTLWGATVTYDLNDIVEGSDGLFYKSLTNANTASDPTTTPTEWEEIRFIGVWTINILYAIGEVVQTSNGNLWAAQTATAGNDPSTDVGTNWKPAVSGSAVNQSLLWDVATPYLTGDNVKTSDGNLWKALTNSTGVNPSTNDGSIWGVATDTRFTQFNTTIITRQSSFMDLQYFSTVSVTVDSATWANTNTVRFSKLRSAITITITALSGFFLDEDAVSLGSVITMDAPESFTLEITKINADWLIKVY